MRTDLVLPAIRVASFMIWQIPVQMFYSILLPKKASVRVRKTLIQWGHLVFKAFHVKLKVVGKPQSLPQGNIVLMANHQSQLDIPGLIAALDEHMGFVAKQELSKVPVLNHWMKKLDVFLSTGVGGVKHIKRWR